MRSLLFALFSLHFLTFTHTASATDESALKKYVLKQKRLQHRSFLKTLPLTQPIPLSFGGGQYISSSSGQRIERGDPVVDLKSGYLRCIKLNKDKGLFTIKKSGLYTVDYFLSIKLVVDTTATNSQVMAIRINGEEIVQTALSVASSTALTGNLVTAIYSGEGTASMYLRNGDKVELVYSETSTSPSSFGSDHINVYAENNDLAAAIFFTNNATADS